MPRPGALDLFDPGFTIAVEQWQWGHPTVKPTWLYIVGTRTLPPRPPFDWKTRPSAPRVYVTKPDGRRIHRYVGIANNDNRHLTPPLFAQWLVDLARSCRNGQT